MARSAEPVFGDRAFGPVVTAALQRPPSHFIDGGFVVDDRHPFAVVDPSNGQQIATAALADAEMVSRAVQAARSAFDEGPWRRQFTPSDRQAAIWHFGQLVAEHGRDLAQLDALDAGRPYHKVFEGDIPASAEHLKYFAGWCTKLNGATYAVDSPGAFAYSVREPVGVVGLITPWNYPVLMAIWKLAPALAAGNAVILKPAEQTPLSALVLAELATEAGIPPGVINVVTGDGPTTGAALVSHQGVDKIGFTGSGEVARSIIASSATDLKRVSLELGGKSANIVCADADLDLAARGSAAAVFGNTGQSCTAGSRLFVDRSIYDDFVERFAAATSKLTLGDALSFDRHDLGPLVSREQLERVAGFVASAPDDALAVAAGGERPGGDLGDGFFFEPTILTGDNDEARVVRDEVFGPVVAVLGFDDLSEAIRRANDTRFGLAAGLWTTDLATAHTAAAALQAGTVWVNTWGLTEPGVPFGGIKQSGHGREMGPDAFELYTETKAVWIQNHAYS